METYKPCEPIPKTESQIVYEYNHCNPPRCPRYVIDPIDVYDINGYFLGYSWNYEDAVELVINLNDTVLHSDLEHIDEYEVYLSNKSVEFNFTDIRGNLKYTFNVPYEPNTSENIPWWKRLEVKLPLNTTEENTIERNTYKLSLVLINLATGKRTSLLIRPYDVYVK